MKKVTSKDVAKLAGVSQSTVSLILNNKQNVSFSQKTVKNVIEAAKELNYKLPQGSGYKNKNNNLILLITPTMNNPYYPLLTQVIEKNASEEGYNVLLVNTHRNKGVEKINLESLTDKSGVAGVIYEFSPSFPELLEEISHKLPVIIVGEKDDNLNIDTIGLNSYKSGMLVAEHLVELGHKDIAFISTPVNSMSLSRKKRLEGIKDKLKEYGLAKKLVTKFDENEHESLNSIYEIEVGYNLTLDLLENNEVTAIIGVNDMTASGIMNALHTKGYQIPEDISVCGFDNIFVSTVLNPGLTTIDHSIEHRGKLSINILLEKINNMNNSSKEKQSDLTVPKPTNTFKIEYEPQLIVRNSTGKKE